MCSRSVAFSFEFATRTIALFPVNHFGTAGRKNLEFSDANSGASEINVLHSAMPYAAGTQPNGNDVYNLHIINN